MSWLRQLLTTASRQYASLTLNRHFDSSSSVFKRSFHSSACMRVDVNDLMDKEHAHREENAKQTESKVLKKKPFTNAPIDPAYMPGGTFIPSDETLNHLVDGVPFYKLPRVYIKATHQNTIISVRDFKLGKNICLHSGGTVGFENCKKKSAVCGQTVGLAVGMDIVKKGYKNVCVVVTGQGSGRLSAIKGIQLAGLNVVSISDRTNPNVSTRPRKPRSL